MGPIERYDNPAVLDARGIAQLIAKRRRPILQFSKPVPDSMLREVNALCEEHGDALAVRFYGFYLSAFDARTLRMIPAVASLLLDCLHEVSHVEELGNLARLRSLSLGIDLLDASAILAMPNLRRLKQLSVGDTKKGAIDLSPVSTMKELTELTVSGQETAIETIGECKRLRTLRLRMIGRRVKLRFVAGLPRLRSLRLALGGRDDIDEVAHPTLSELEVVRVRGLARLDPGAFPGLQSLSIEDQLQLETVEFHRGNPELTCLSVVNCKKLRRLGGLRRLGSLRELRLVRTPLELDGLLAEGLPRSLRSVVVHTGRARVDAGTRERLDGLGYTE